MHEMTLTAELFDQLVTAVESPNKFDEDEAKYVIECYRDQTNVQTILSKCKLEVIPWDAKPSFVDGNTFYHFGVKVMVGEEELVDTIRVESNNNDSSKITLEMVMLDVLSYASQFTHFLTYVEWKDGMGEGLSSEDYEEGLLQGVLLAKCFTPLELATLVKWQNENPQ